MMARGRIKILYVHSSGNNFYGSEVVLLRILENLNHEFATEVLLPEEGIFYQRLQVEGFDVRVADLGNYRQKRWRLKRIMQFYRVVNETEPDLIHLTSASPMLYVWPIAKWLNIPLICHVQCPYDRSELRRYFPHRSDLVILISKNLKSIFSDKHQGKLHVVYNSVEEPNIDREAAKKKLAVEFEFPPEIPVVGMLGQIIHRKGIDHFLKAMAKVILVIPDLKIFIVGSDTSDHEKYSDQMKRLAEDIAIGDRIIWTGFRKDSQNLMAGMDILCVPSRSEGFGLVAAESMAVGTPVIASEVEGLAEIIENGVDGILVPLKNLERKLADKIIYLLQDPEIVRFLSMSGREKIKRKFSIPTHIRRIEGIYNSILAERKI
jgi:glycosyltransferase involved in cell wall biosynthesis